MWELREAVLDNSRDIGLTATKYTGLQQLQASWAARLTFTWSPLMPRHVPLVKWTLMLPGVSPCAQNVATWAFGDASR